MNTKNLSMTAATLLLSVTLIGCVATRDRPVTESAPPMEKAEVIPPMESMAQPPQIQAMIEELGGRVTFASNSSELSPDAKDALTQIGKLLGENPGERIRIDGFADSVGTAEYNRELSAERVLAVSDVLLASGAMPDQISSFEHGEERPIASNDTYEGRAENRRVELSTASS